MLIWIFSFYVFAGLKRYDYSLIIFKNCVVAMPYPDLERKINRYCGKVANRVICSRRNPRVCDYPAVAVACRILNGNNRIFCGVSAKPRMGMYVPLLEAAMNNLGGVGQRRNGCPYVIGNCAEPHVANRLLNNLANAGLDQIVFSAALRPRTRQTIPFCANCRAIFPTLN